MRNIRIIVAYDGTDLAGYQKQPDDKGLTVQGCLEYGLSKFVTNPYKSMELLEQMQVYMQSFKYVRSKHPDLYQQKTFLVL